MTEKETQEKEALLYGKFEMPLSIRMDQETKSNTFGRFIAEPFERGFGHTLGNAMRRILLTSLEAPAILSVRIEGVSHEFTAIPGVIEDMTIIILNLKEALLRLLPLQKENVDIREIKTLSKVIDITQEMITKAKGAYPVRLKDILDPSSSFEMINSEQLIFTVTKPFQRRMDLRVGFGRGYVPSERQEGFQKIMDEILIDSIFSPVRLVTYFIENTRVGHVTDFDRLVLDVTTDGRVTPEEALSYATQIGIEHFKVFDSLRTHDVVFEQEKQQKNKDRDELLSKLALRINEVELSVRSANCLASANIETIGELVMMSEADLLKFRNFGKKSLTEIKDKLALLGLRLGMENELKEYGFTKENIKNIQKNMEQPVSGNEPT